MNKQEINHTVPTILHKIKLKQKRDKACITYSAPQIRSTTQQSSLPLGLSRSTDLTLNINDIQMPTNNRNYTYCAIYALEVEHCLTLVVRGEQDVISNVYSQANVYS